MKKIEIICLVVGILAIVSCKNPKDDAKEVCDCYQNVITNPKLAEDYGLQKCQALSTEKLLKYKNSPKELLQFNVALDSCVGNFNNEKADH